MSINVVGYVTKSHSLHTCGLPFVGKETKLIAYDAKI
jgi:hypothetical protein